MANNFDKLFNDTDDNFAYWKTPEQIKKIIKEADQLDDKTERINKLYKCLIDLIFYIKFVQCGGTNYNSLGNQRKFLYKHIFPKIENLVVKNKGLYYITLSNIKYNIKLRPIKTGIILNITPFPRGTNYLSSLGQESIDILKKFLKEQNSEFSIFTSSKDEGYDRKSIISVDQIIPMAGYKIGNVQLIPNILNTIKQDLNLDNQIDHKKYEIRVINEVLGNPCICEICEIQIVGDNITPDCKNKCKRCYKDKKNARLRAACKLKKSQEQ